MFKHGFKNRLKSLFNLSAWLGVSSLYSGAVFIRKLFTQITDRNYVSDVKHESFDEAVKFYNLSEEELEKRKEHFKLMSWIYGIMLLSGIAYNVYLGVKHNWTSFFMMLSFNFMLFSFFFRENFWYFQIRERKLGLTFMDWLNRI
tara:strand:+ start:6843 stop:7277 length:435 start_codon:yes stop_codon:yes gene_type:complete